ncbi:GroES-like protein [Cristinia sonorae]|uniref:GroES-like protein n=1 Tax=Cristinia sonorae TaxID=1940300 RepID=A0A8K0UFZ8_9AGAR|nr:GroES-like protein [Cristinia sonorae]
MSVPTTQKALFLQGLKGDWAVESTSVPEPSADQVLVRVEASGLNPVDWKIRELGFTISSYPAILGFDGSGVVVKVGDNVTQVKVGDKVLFGADRADTSTRTFQQYALAFGDLVAKIPDNITFDQAAAVNAGFATAGIALYGPKHSTGGAALLPPWQEEGKTEYANHPILIVGGSSTVGQAAIQYAKLSGFFPIITTVSPSNTALALSLGATHTIDRSTPASSLPSAVAAITSTPISVIFDTIGNSDVQNVTYDDVLKEGKVFIAGSSPSNIKNPVEGKEIIRPAGFLNDAPHRSFAVDLWQRIAGYLASGDFKPNRVEYLPGGLASVPDGLERLKHGKVSGQKLVVRPTETV